MSHHFTATDIEQHQKRTLGSVRCTCGGGLGHSDTCPRSLLIRGSAGLPIPVLHPKRRLPQPVAMSRPEREMGMMLEAQKRGGEIVDYRFQGMSLAYSPDPETGILLRYKCDYVVIVACKEMIPFLTGPGKTSEQVDVESACHMRFEQYAAIKIIECKGHGKHAISAAAKLRFKGAKAAWPMFKFEMHQRGADGSWRRVL